MAQKTESRHKRVIQCFDSTPLAADVMISTHYDDLIQPLSPNPPLVSESEPDLKNVTNVKLETLLASVTDIAVIKQCDRCVTN